MLLGLALSLSLVQASGTGIVRDQSGGAVPGASISVRSGSGIDEVTVSGPDGRFVLEKTPDGQATLVVRAVGFAVKEQPFSGEGDIEVVLEPPTILETVTVTAARTEERLGNIPASIKVLDRADIRQSPGVVADDVLRQVPTFSLFRRSSSLTAQPTTQGVSLRGIGPSGVSRTLVLLDGIPFNDPFGGWVYWTRVPLDNVDRIEIVEGPSSNLYGNYAMGGVINLLVDPGVATNRRDQIAVRQPEQPEAGYLGQRRLAQAVALGPGRGLRHGRLQERGAVRARSGRRRGERDVSPRQRQAGLCALQPPADVLSRRVLRARIATTAR